MPNLHEIEPVPAFVSAFVLSGLAGLAALMRSEIKVTWVTVISAILNSGLLGLTVAFLWFSYFRENIFFLLGLCVLAGLGGTKTVEFALGLFKKWAESKTGKGEPESKKEDGVS